MDEKNPPSLKSSFMHLAVLFMITAFVAGIVGCIMPVGNLIFFCIAAVLFILAVISFIISKKSRDTP